jgi:hypothetical protein
MSTLSDLITTITQSQYFNELMSKHKANGVPTDSWLSTLNTGLSLTQIDAQLLADLRQSVSTLAASMFLDYASDDGLTLFAQSQYGIDRAGAQFTQGNVRLLSIAGAPVYNFVPGQITIGTQGDTTNQKLYTNLTGGTLNPGSFIDLVFRANEPGSSYNIANATPMDMKTSFAGVTVSNPIYPPTATWITQLGVDEESDDQLKLRCKSRWGTIGAECNNEAMQYFALLPPAGYTASPVKYVRVMSDWLNGQYWPGAITVIVGNDFGGLSPTDLAAVRANFENPAKYGIGRILDVRNMEFLDTALVASVNAFVSSGITIPQLEQQVEASLADFQSFIDIGEVVFPEKIGARMEDGNKKAIRDVNLTAPNAPVQPNFYQRVRIRLDLSTITYNLVSG